MSDDDFMEEEEFDFQYSGSEEEEMCVDLENKYYEAKGYKTNEPLKAIELFLDLVKEDTEKSEWAFKSLKQTIKTAFHLQDYERCVKHYEELLTFSVTRNTIEKAINSILDLCSSAQNLEFMERIYKITLDSLVKNDRLWLKTNLKLAKLWLDRKEYSRLSKLLRLLHQSDETSTLLLEIYALEIQMYTEQKNNKRLKEVYQKCLHVKSAIPHPRIMGLIRECGGKMYMYEQEWQNAQTDFFEAFKSYDEVGSPQRIQCLKYLVLANMLCESQINPFDSQETKPYENHPEITEMTNLVHAYQQKDLKRFQRILKTSSIMNDLFIQEYIDDVLRNIRMQVLLKLVQPYTRIEISFIAQHLSISQPQVEELLVALVLDGKLVAKIDQLLGVVELNQESDESLRYDALHDWSQSAQQLLSITLRS